MKIPLFFFLFFLGGCTFKQSANCTSSLYRLNKTRMNLSRCWFWLMLNFKCLPDMNGIDWGMTLLLAVSKISDQGRQCGLPQWMPWNSLGSKSIWTVLFPLTELNRKVVVLFTTIWQSQFSSDICGHWCHLDLTCYRKNRLYWGVGKTKIRKKY